MIGVGDTSYDTFCLAAKNIKNTFISKGYKIEIPLLTLDMSQEMDPEELAQEWIQEIQDQL